MRGTGADMARRGMLAALAGVLALVAIYTQVFREVFDEEGRLVRIAFPAAPQLYASDDVRLEGKSEGEVRSVQRRPDGAALVTVEIADDAGPLYRNARATLSWRTLLGGAFYVDLERGTPDAGPLGDAVIPPAQTARQVELDELQSVFRGGARTGTRALLEEGGAALAQPDGPTTALRRLTQVAPTATTALRAARGRQGGADLRRLIRSTAATMRALDAPDDGLQQLVEGAAGTLQTTGRRAPELRAALHAMSASLRETESTLARVERSLDGVDDLTAELRPAVPTLDPALSRLRAALAPTDALLQRARPLLRSLQPATRSLARAAVPARRLVTGLKTDVERLDKTILPYLREPDDVTGKPTSTMFGATFAHLGGLMSQKDLNGHFMRFPVSGGSTSGHLPCRTAFTDSSTDKLLACQTLEQALKTYFSYAKPLTPSPSGGRRP